MIGILSNRAKDFKSSEADLLFLHNSAKTILFLPNLSTIAEAIFAAIVVLPVPDVPVTRINLELKILSVQEIQTSLCSQPLTRQISLPE